MVVLWDGGNKDNLSSSLLNVGHYESCEVSLPPFLISPVPYSHFHLAAWGGTLGLSSVKSQAFPDVSHHCHSKLNTTFMNLSCGLVSYTQEKGAKAFTGDIYVSLDIYVHTHIYIRVVRLQVPHDTIHITKDGSRLYIAIYFYTIHNVKSRARNTPCCAPPGVFCKDECKNISYLCRLAIMRVAWSLDQRFGFPNCGLHPSRGSPGE